MVIGGEIMAYVRLLSHDGSTGLVSCPKADLASFGGYQTVGSA